jgi:hypothetical protein
VIPAWPPKLNRLTFPARALLLAGRVCGTMRRMVSLTDSQIKTVMTTANAVPVERRGHFSGTCRRDVENALSLH